MAESSVNSYNNSMLPIDRKGAEGETMSETEVSTEAQSEIVIGSGFIILGTMTLFVLVPKSIKVPENIPNVALSPAMWPKAISIFIILLGTFLLIGSFIALWRQHKRLSISSLNFFQNKISFSWRGLLAVAMLLPYFFAINFFGMLLSSVLAVFIYMLVAGEKSILALIAVSLVFPVLLTLFFIHVASVMIPLGPLELFM